MDARLPLYRLLKWAFPYGGRIAALARLPGVGPLLQRWLFAGDDIYYVPPDRVVETAQPREIRVDQALEPPEDVALPSAVVERFVRQASHRWIMHECICRAAEGCSDYPIELGCLFLGEAATGIHPDMGRPVSEAQALAHVQRCREAGLVHLIGRNKLDTLWLGVGPGQRLLTLCHCCPCCCLWRLRPRLPRAIGRVVTRMPGVSLRVTEGCIGCGDCAAACFVEAVHMASGRAHITADCVGCGRCAEQCPEGAIELRVDGPAADRTAARLSQVVDVT